MSAEPQTQRFAKALDTFASSQILELIGEAEMLASSGQIDPAFDKLDFANGRLPPNVRLDKDPSVQLAEDMIKVVTLEDFRKKEHEYMILSPENLKREYYSQIEEYKLDKFKEIKKQITDAMQEHNMYFQETRRYHKTDAPQVSEI